MYASYPDVSAEDFLYVQTDTTYRKVWDKSAITLEVVDTDPVNKAKSQIIYWEMLWPVSIINCQTHQHCIGTAPKTILKVEVQL